MQSETKESKTTFNVVKNASKNLQSQQKQIKISNSFKHFIARIISEFLQTLEYKLDCYVNDMSNKTIKYNDLQKVLRLSFGSRNQRDLEN